MLMPKRTKYRKVMKGRNRGYARSGYTLAFGDIALKAVAKITTKLFSAKKKYITFYYFFCNEFPGASSSV